MSERGLLRTCLDRLLLRDLPDDGFGQSLADDVRFLVRTRACRRRPTVWHAPSFAEQRRWDEDALVGRFADTTIALTVVDGRRWVLRENDWFGWPDPNRFVLFVLDGGRVWTAGDFNDWPAAWTGVDPEAWRTAPPPVVPD